MKKLLVDKCGENLIMRRTSTKEKILKEGKSLLQQYGYNGFSFQDIANSVGIKKPSLYDHFSSKDDLIIAILAEYNQLFEAWKIQVNDLNPPEKIRKVFQVFYSFSCDHKKVCPVLALIADMKVISKSAQKEMKNFIDNWLDWLSEIILEGQTKNVFQNNISPHDLSSFIYSQLMGSQLQAKIQGNPNLINEASELVLILIKKR